MADPDLEVKRLFEHKMLAKHPNRDLAKFYRQLGSEFECFARRGTFLIEAPVGHMLGGFSFYPKEGDKNSRWLQPCVIPLFVPQSDLHLGYGDRIPRNPSPGLAWFWVSVYGDSDGAHFRADQVMKDVGLPILNRLLTVDGFLDYLLREHRFASSRSYVDLAATLGYRGQLTRAAEAVGDLRTAISQWSAGRKHSFYETNNVRLGVPVQVLSPADPDGEPMLEDWERDHLQIAAVIESFTLKDDHLGLLRQMRDWREENLDRLGIRDIVTPSDELFDV